MCLNKMQPEKVNIFTKENLLKDQEWNQIKIVKKSSTMGRRTFNNESQRNSMFNKNSSN